MIGERNNTTITQALKTKKAAAFLGQRKERSGRATVLLTKILNQMNPNYEVDIRRVKVEEQLTRGLCLVKFPNPCKEIHNLFHPFFIDPPDSPGGLTRTVRR